MASLALPALAARSGTMRIVLPFTAGSGTDVSARLLAEGITSSTGKSVIVDNKPGGNTVIGTLEVARAEPDGNTVLFTTGGHTTNGVLMKKPPYDPIASFTPITMVTRSAGWLLVVGQNSPYKTFQQFLDAARKSPKKLTYGSSGIGNSTHVMAALFSKAAGIEMTHIPYKGTPITDLIAGTIDCSVQGVATVMEMVRTNRLRALAISSPQRIPPLPNVPAFKEFGFDANLPGWSGVFAPAKLAPEDAEALYQDLRKATQLKGFQDLAALSMSEVVMMPPKEFQPYLGREMDTYRRILPPLNIEME